MNVLRLANQAVDHATLLSMLRAIEAEPPTSPMGQAVVQLATDLARARATLEQLAHAVERLSWRRHYPIGSAVEVLLRSGWCSALVRHHADGSIFVFTPSNEWWCVLFPEDIRPRGAAVSAGLGIGVSFPYEVCATTVFVIARHLDRQYYYSPEGWLGEEPYSEPCDTFEQARAAADLEIDTVRQSGARHG